MLAELLIKMPASDVLVYLVPGTFVSILISEFC